jgi:hypothetical protein
MSSKSNPCRDALHPWSDIYPGAEWFLKQYSADKEAE